MPYKPCMPGAPISVIESATYLAKAAKILNDAEREAVVDMLAREPGRGDLIPGGGGIRKVRFAIAGTGKRGGARVIYYFSSEAIPLLIITIYAKNAKADLTGAETAALAKAVKAYAKEWKRRS